MKFMSGLNSVSKDWGEGVVTIVSVLVVILDES